MIEIELQGNEALRTLSIAYNTAEYKFKIRCRIAKSAKTPRQVLSFVSSVWNPYGFVSPFVVRGRVFLQELWPLKLDWDDLIDDERLQVRTKIEEEARKLDELGFPRRYRRRSEAASDYQVLVFSGSSMQAECAVGYYRFVYESEDVDVSLVSARTLVTPLKRQTIPRLELDALRIGINVAATIVKECDVEVKRLVLWTDSIICKHWLTQPSRWYKDFVAHRIVNFQERVESIEQKGVDVAARYVPSELNAVDIGTRGVTPSNLDSDSTWQRGLAFL